MHTLSDKPSQAKTSQAKTITDPVTPLLQCMTARLSLLCNNTTFHHYLGPLHMLANLLNGHPIAPLHPPGPSSGPLTVVLQEHGATCSAAPCGVLRVRVVNVVQPRQLQMSASAAPGASAAMAAGH